MEEYLIKSCQEYYPYAVNTIADWTDTLTLGETA